MDEEKKIMEIYYYHAANQRPINSTEKRVMLDFIGTGTCSQTLDRVPTEQCINQLPRCKTYLQDIEHVSSCITSSKQSSQCSQEQHVSRKMASTFVTVLALIHPNQFSLSQEVDLCLKDHYPISKFQDKRASIR